MVVAWDVCSARSSTDFSKSSNFRQNQNFMNDEGVLGLCCGREQTLSCQNSQEQATLGGLLGTFGLMVRPPYMVGTSDSNNWNTDRSTQ
jgi:hypothetical protein